MIYLSNGKDLFRFRMIAIYELLDPQTNECRYIGQTIEPDTRLAWHIQAAKRGEKRWVYNWIRSLLSHGVSPIMRIIEHCSLDKEANDRESHWILLYRSYGVDLTNLTDGGGGIRGMKHSEETKAKIGRAHTGKVLTPEQRMAMSKARTGVPLSPERREVAVAALRRRVWTDEQKRAISDRMKGNNHCLGQVHSPERIAAQSRVASGQNGAGALLTDEQATEIRSRAAAGEKQHLLADEFGVDRVCLHRIVRRKTYKTAVDLHCPARVIKPKVNRKRVPKFCKLEDDMVLSMSLSDCALATGRTYKAVWKRRKRLLMETAFPSYFCHQNGEA